MKKEDIRKEIIKLKEDSKKSYKDYTDTQTKIFRLTSELTRKSKHVYDDVSLPSPNFTNKRKHIIGYRWYNPDRKINLSLTKEERFFRKIWIIRLMYSSEYSEQIVKTEKEGLKICNELKDKYILSP